MRVCLSCGEVYPDDVGRCRIDGCSLTPWSQTGKQAIFRDHPEDLAEVIDQESDSSSTEVARRTAEIAGALRFARGERDTEELRSTGPLEIALRDEATHQAEVRSSERAKRGAPARVAPLPEPTSGTLLGERYRLDKQLGLGGLGAVFSADDLRLEKRIAVKVLSPRATYDDDSLALYRREVVAASEIGHVGIAHVTDFDTTDDGITYITLEALAGTDLAAELRHSAPLPQARAVQLAIRIAQALGAAHAAGMIHRDLKPESVYVVRDDQVKVIDFGLVNLLAAQPLPGAHGAGGSPLGSPYYLAPERVQRDAKLDARTDIYALGAILYEMLVKHPPFRGHSYDEVIAKTIGEDPVPPSAVNTKLALPRALDKVVLRALARDPAKRFGSMTELAGALERVLDKPVSGERPSPPEAVAPEPPEAPAVSAAINTADITQVVKAHDSQGTPLMQTSRVALIALAIVVTIAAVGIYLATSGGS